MLADVHTSSLGYLCSEFATYYLKHLSYNSLWLSVKMTTPQVVETSVTINRTTFTRTTIFLLLINDMTPGLKPFFCECSYNRRPNNELFRGVI